MGNGTSSQVPARAVALQVGPATARVAAVRARLPAASVP